MGDNRWDIMKGTFYEGAFNGKVPGADAFPKFKIIIYLLCYQ
jgi:hypothetical protein